MTGSYFSLNRKQVIGVSIYSLILPISMLYGEYTGEWAIVMAAIISLPSAPFVFSISWFIAIEIQNPLLVFVGGWITGIIINYLLYTEYLSLKKINPGKDAPSSNNKTSIYLRWLIALMATLMSLGYVLAYGPR
ncbi:MAG TPA: hypothetical protein VIM96_04510 [Pseudomonadales bacterium]